MRRPASQCSRICLRQEKHERSTKTSVSSLLKAARSPTLGSLVDTNVHLNENKCLLDREEPAVSVEMDVGAETGFPVFGALQL